MRNALFTVAALVVAVGLLGCQSSGDKSVKTNYMQQWTTVAADVKKTTASAQDVLNEMSLLEVKSSATDVDGMASGKKANGTKIHVSIAKEGTGSKASVQVGTMGDPDLGTSIASKIKAKAEAK